MADGLEINITSSELLSALDRAVSQLEKPGELMAIIGATMEQNIQVRFVQKVDPSGNAWAPLAESTMKRKKGRGSILEFTGHGLASLAANPRDTDVEIGFAEAYMGYHETSTRSKSGEPRMPRRGMLTDDWQAGTLGKQDQADILDDIADYLASLGLSS